MQVEGVEYVLLLFKGVKLCLHIFIMYSITKSHTLCMCNKRQKYTQKALIRQDFFGIHIKKNTVFTPNWHLLYGFLDL